MEDGTRPNGGRATILDCYLLGFCPKKLPNHVIYGQKGDMLKMYAKVSVH